MRRWARLALVAAAVLLAAGIVLVGSVSLYLRSPWGGAVLGRILEEEISAGIAGRLRIGRASPAGIRRLHFEHVGFAAPDGRLVLGVDSVSIRLRGLALLRGRLEVIELEIEGARLEVAAGGVDVTFASPGGRSQGRERGQGPIPPRPPLPIVLEAIRIQDLSARWADAPAGAAPFASISRMGGGGEGAWEPGIAWIDLGLRGQADLPLRRDLGLSIRSRLIRGWLLAEPVTISLGQSRIAVGGGARLGEALAVSAAAAGVVDPAEAAFLDLPLAGPLPFTASLSGRPGAWEGAIDLEPEGAGAVFAQGRIEGPRGSATLRLREVDPSRWIRGAPPAALSGSAAVSGALRPVDLAVELALSEGRLMGEAFRGAHLQGRFESKGGGPLARIDSLEVALEGAQLEGAGELGPEGAFLEARAQVDRLAAQRKLLEHLMRRRLDRLSGRGEVRGSWEGPWERPLLSIEARMDRLCLGGWSARALALDGRVRLDPGGLPAGSLEGSIGGLRRGSLRLGPSRLGATRADDGAFSLWLDPAEEPETAPAATSEFEEPGREGAGAGGDGRRAGGDEGRGEPPGPGPSKAPEEGEASKATLRLRAAGGVDREQLELQTFSAHFVGQGLDLAAEGDGMVRAGRTRGRIAAAAGGVGRVRAAFDLPLDLAAAPPSAPLQLHLDVSPLDLLGLGPLLGLDLPIARVRGQLEVQGIVASPGVELDATVASLQIPNQPSLWPLDARLHGGLRGGGLEVALEVWEGGERVAEVAASGPMGAEQLARDPVGALTRLLASDGGRIAGEVRGIDLSMLASALELPALDGAGAADFDLRGPLQDPRGHLAAQLRGGPVGPFRFLHVEARAELGAGEVQLLASVRPPAPPPHAATVRVLPGEGGSAARREPAASAEGHPDAGAPADERRPPAAPGGEEAGGELDRDRGGADGRSEQGVDDDERGAGRGPVRDPGGGEGRSDRGGPGHESGPVTRGQGEAIASPRGDEGRQPSSLGPALELRFLVGASLAALLAGEVEASAPIQLEVALDRLDLSTLITGRGSAVVTSADADGLPARRRRARLRAGPEERLGAAHLLGGLASASGKVEGTVGNPSGALRLHARSLSWQGVALGDAELALELAEGAAGLQFHAIDAALGSIASALDLGPGLSPFRLAREGTRALLPLPLRLRMEAHQLSMAPLAVFLGSNRTGGLLSLDLSADGSVAAIRPRGQLQLEGGSLEFPGGLFYRGIEVQLRLAEDRLELVQLRGGAAGGGSFAAAGTLGAPGATPFETLIAVLSQTPRGEPAPFALGLRTRDLPVGGPGGIAADLSADAEVEGRIDPVRGLLGTVAIDGARIELPLRSPRALQAVGRPDDIVIVSGPKAAANTASPSGERRRWFPVELHVRLPAAPSESGPLQQLPRAAPLPSRRLRIESPDVRLEATVDLEVRRDREGAVLGDGRARTTSGTATALGRTFEIDRAVVSWRGGPLANPYLDVSARYDARRAIAWADVGGTLQRPTISLRSDPPLPESQIVSLILSGRTQNPGLVPVENAPLAARAPGATSPGASSVPAASVIGAALTQTLGQALGPRVPVSVIATESTSGPQVEAGTFLSQRLYLGFVRNFLPEPGENANEVRAEYEISRTVGIETRFGDAAAGGVDVVWQKSFETPGQQRARKAAAAERERRRRERAGDGEGDAAAAGDGGGAEGQEAAAGEEGAAAEEEDAPSLP